MSYLYSAARSWWHNTRRFVSAVLVGTVSLTAWASSPPSSVESWAPATAADRDAARLAQRVIAAGDDGQAWQSFRSLAVHPDIPSEVVTGTIHGLLTRQDLTTERFHGLLSQFADDTAGGDAAYLGRAQSIGTSFIYQLAERGFEDLSPNARSLVKSRLLGLLTISDAPQVRRMSDRIVAWKGWTQEEVASFGLIHLQATNFGYTFDGHGASILGRVDDGLESVLRQHVAGMWSQNRTIAWPAIWRLVLRGDVEIGVMLATIRASAVTGGNCGSEPCSNTVAQLDELIFMHSVMQMKDSEILDVLVDGLGGPDVVGSGSPWTSPAAWVANDRRRGFAAAQLKRRGVDPAIIRTQILIYVGKLTESQPAGGGGSGGGGGGGGVTQPFVRPRSTLTMLKMWLIRDGIFGTHDLPDVRWSPIGMKGSDGC